MSEFKGTKGKWFAQNAGRFFEVRSEERSYYVLSSGCHLDSIDNKKSMIGLWPDFDEAKANADLMAASKDLLEALLRSKEYIGSDCPAEIQELIDFAITKALGGARS